MSYINPYMLAALAAAAIPVILHLLNLQKAEKIEFSSIMLIKELRKSRFRKLRIKHFLLMLIRVLTVVFLVLAFAGPYVKNIGGKGSDVRKTGLIIVDTSYSMNVKNDSVRLAEDAIKTADVISGLFTSSDIVVKQFAGVSTGDSSVIEHKPYLNSILKTVYGRIQGNIPDEVFVVTDMQRVNFEGPAFVHPEGLPDAHFYFIDLSQRVPGNVSVNNVIVDSRIPNPGGIIRIRTVVKNEGKYLVQGIRIKLFENGVLKAERPVDLNPEERKEAELEFVSEYTGMVNCRAEISGMNSESNALKEDDSFNFGIFIPSKINTGILKSGDGDTKYITSVFDAANAGLKQGSRVYDYSIISSLSDISRFDVLFLAGFDSKSQADADALKNFVAGGKGVFFFPSRSYTGSLISKVGSVNYGNKINPGKEMRLSDVRSFEPLFEGLFRGKQGNGGISMSVKAAELYDMKPGGNAYPLMTAGDNQPFLILDKTNFGSVIASSVSADKTMSDFPENEIFAPLVLRSAVYLSNPAFDKTGVTGILNHDTLESSFTKSNSDFIKDVLAKNGVKKYDVMDRKSAMNIETLVSENRKGKSLWIYAAIVVLLLVLSELIAVKKIYRNKE